MPSLYMLSFKANRVREVPAASLAPTVGWLILSDNQIESLPASIGRCVGMRKLLLAGNRLTNEGLPAEMAALTSLELVRLADNRLTKIPAWVLTHPTLAWVALAANPATDPFADDAHARAHAEGTGSNPTGGENENAKPARGRARGGVGRARACARTRFGARADDFVFLASSSATTSPHARRSAGVAPSTPRRS